MSTIEVVTRAKPPEKIPLRDYAQQVQAAIDECERRPHKERQYRVMLENRTSVDIGADDDDWPEGAVYFSWDSNPRWYPLEEWDQWACTTTR